MCEQYLYLNHKSEIINILKDEDSSQHYSININFLEMFETNITLGHAILGDPEKLIQELNSSAIKVQQTLNNEGSFSIKHFVNCRIFGLPVCAELQPTFPSNEDTDNFLQITAIVIRITERKLLEFQKQYVCVKCKHTIEIKAKAELNNIIEPPKRCLNAEGCNSSKLVAIDEKHSDNCKDYQEIKIQEQVTKRGIGSIPQAMWVTLEDDLVDVCQPGDNVTICGIVKRRWTNIYVGKKFNIQLILKANHIQINNASIPSGLISADKNAEFKEFWEKYSDDPLAGRDLILQSFCPQIFGAYLVKLAIAMVLAGGSQIKEDASITGMKLRSDSHLLLVGDPGTGKSQLLRFASKVIKRAVLTTGIGTTAAGLTATAIHENGEWQLEGGALVLADGGICCIDEFNSMKQHDRISMHEAMEQQSISVAKANIVRKLRTKCSIVAACNAKGGHIDPNKPLNVNVAIASPLLSRFDLIILMRDNLDDEWDEQIADYILNDCANKTDHLWNIEYMQAYFAAIRSNTPLLTSEANQILSAYYQMQRQRNGRSKGRTSVRMLDSLIRLSQGHAKLMYHNEVQTMDAVFSVALVNATMETDAGLFQLDFHTQTMFPEDANEHYETMMEIVLKRLNLEHLIGPKKPGGSNTKKILKSRFFAEKDDELSENDLTDSTERVNDPQPGSSTYYFNEMNKKEIHIKKKTKITQPSQQNEIDFLNNLPSVNDLDSFLSFDSDSVSTSTQSFTDTGGSNTQESLTSLKETTDSLPLQIHNDQKLETASEAPKKSSTQLFKEKFAFKPRKDPLKDSNNEMKLASQRSIFENDCENVDFDI